MVQILGWLSAEAARASRWKRSSVCGDAVTPSGRTLMATTRSRRVSLGPIHFAHPAGTERADDFVGAEASAGGKGQGGPGVLVALIVVTSGH